MLHFANQPPNSPDFNVLDLGFFNAIQSLQQQKQMRNIDELVTAVQESFWKINPETLESTWITWQKGIEASMLEEGSNRYKIPHLAKDAARKKSMLTMEIVVSDEAINSALEFLK